MRTKFIKPIALCLVLFAASFQASAQLVINEFMASNAGAYVDPDYDASADWIEIYNSGSTAISLNGYYITDNLNDLTKWQINSNVSIQPDQYLIIWADGMNTGLHTIFKLSASGEDLAIVSPSQVVIDSYTFGAQEPNISMGRKSVDSNEWSYFTTSTPGKPNSSVTFDGVVLSDPSFSFAGGIYKTPISVELTTIFGGEVHYTLDGSEPDELSPVASFPIDITENTVIRARIYKPGQVLGPIKTNSYFIDTENRLTNLPIVSLSSAPDNFWSSSTGIYAQSFKPEWEIPVNIEMFENDGRDGAAFNLKAGVKINGLYSWQLPQKMLGVYFRKAYGSSKLEYPLIFDKDRKSFDSFALRASGSDWSYTMFRDGLMQNATMENTNLDNSGFRACVVYINGKYMGIHNIREKIDADFVVGNHGINDGTFDMVENEDFAEAGDLLGYNILKTYFSKDLTVQANMDTLATKMDIENFTDLICTEVIVGNSSVDHNVMAWKPKESGLWKWIIMDLDRGFFSPTSRMISFFVNQTSWPFKQLMTNAKYKKYFGLRLANHIFTSFNPDRIDSMIDLHKNTIAAEMPYHIQRWKGTSSSYGNPISSVDYWLTQVEAMKTYIGARPSILLNDLTNYGFQTPVSVSVSTFPSNAGNLTFNGMKIPVATCSGGYPGGEEIKLVAEPKAGYTFLGWQSNSQSQLIDMGSIWNYSDTGTDLGTSWYSVGYDDSSWKSGQAEMGYGNSGQKTTLSYGTNSNDKYPTYYFRKKFELTSKEDIQKLTMRVKYDDGAVVYLNGVEIQRLNMPVGTISYSSYAASTNEAPTDEFSVTPNLLVNGQNEISVEIHQRNGTSSDVSFDLGLSAVMSGTSSYISTSKELVVNPTTAFNVTAVFQNNGQCILPAVISDVYTVSKECSPILVPDNVQITSTGKLIIEPGVQLLMSDGVSIFASGAIQARGTASEPILFKSNPESVNKKWGVISIENVSDTSHFSNVILENASKGPRPIYELAALSIAHSSVIIDSVSIDNIYNNPIAAYNSDVSLSNTRLHTDYDGADFLNVKFGKIFIDHCDFSGNNKLDVDAIDFGDLSAGNASVTNSYFHDFTGFNSDAVDLGDHSKGVIIDGIVTYNINDKGVSIGQQSSTKITNSVFLNCGMGAGMKDSSSVVIDHCTYYGNVLAIANYQKHAGDAGANALVTSSILSNSYTSGYQSDEYSAIQIKYSADDTELLPEGNNLFGNPMFTNPNLYNFSLLAGSPLIGTADHGNMGANITLPEIAPSVMISDIAYFTDAGMEDLEFIGLYNPGNTLISLDSCMINKGVTFQFPAGTSISPKEKVFVTSNPYATYWENRNEPIFQWESGRLADEGETIQLTDKYGMIIDQITYNNNSPWPTIQASNQGLTLNSYDVDNHFGESWKLLALDKILTGQSLTSNRLITINQDPSSGVYTVSGLKSEAGNYEVFNLQGRLVQTGTYDFGKATIDLSGQTDGVYFIRLGEDSAKIIRMK